MHSPVRYFRGRLLHCRVSKCRSQPPISVPFSAWNQGIFCSLVFLSQLWSLCFRCVGSLQLPMRWISTGARCAGGLGGRAFLFLSVVMLSLFRPSENAQKVTSPHLTIVAVIYMAQVRQCTFFPSSVFIENADNLRCHRAVR